MERLWMTLDQIKSEYASKDYNPELLLQHLLHHVEASPASAPEGWKDFLQDLTQKISEAMYHTPDYFHRDMVRLAHRAHKLLAAAPTPPSTEDRKAVGTAHITPGASGFTMCVFNATDVPVGTVLYTMQDDKSCAK